MIDTKSATESSSDRRSRHWVPWIVSLGLVVALGAVGVIWFFAGDPPAEVDMTETVSEVTDSTAAGMSAAVETSDGIEGTWAVNTTVGDFTVTDETTATFAGFRVEEVLESIDSTTAVGRTPDVRGSIDIEGSSLTSAEIVVDLTSIVSDQTRREDAIQRALGATSNPEATFVLTGPVEIGEKAAAGEAVDMVATGDLTINGVTNTVQIPLQAQMVDGMILITGSTEIEFAEYSVTAPSAPVVVSVEDHGILEFQIWLSQ